MPENRECQMLLFEYRFHTEASQASQVLSCFIPKYEILRAPDRATWIKWVKGTCEALKVHITTFPRLSIL